MAEQPSGLAGTDLWEAAALSWDACPAWVGEYAWRHRQALRGWSDPAPAAPSADGGGGGNASGVEGALMYDCSEGRQALGCHSGIGDRMRAIMETLKVEGKGV